MSNPFEEIMLEGVITMSCGNTERSSKAAVCDLMNQSGLDSNQISDMCNVGRMTVERMFDEGSDDDPYGPMAATLDKITQGLGVQNSYMKIRLLDKNKPFTPDKDRELLLDKRLKKAEKDEEKYAKIEKLLELEIEELDKEMAAEELIVQQQEQIGLALA